MKEYECSRCGYVYRPEKGDEVHHVPAFTVFADVLESWECPACHAPKRLFLERRRGGAVRRSSSVELLRTAS